MWENNLVQVVRRQIDAGSLLVGRWRCLRHDPITLVATALLAPQAINLSAVLRDVVLCNSNTIAVQILGNVLRTSTQPGQVTSDGQTKVEIAEWNQRREEYIIFALSNFANIREDNPLECMVAA